MIILLLTCLSEIGAAQDGSGSGYHFCLHETRKAPCADAPHDLDPFEGNVFYHFLNGAQQEPFDRFGWRHFVALNWPSSNNEIGQDPQAPRQWQSYIRADDLFEAARPSTCKKPEEGLLISRYYQTSGRPLIDRNGNYVVYDIHINQVAADYIRKNRLNTKAGQQALDEVSFPAGVLDPSTEGAILLKTAWMIMDRPSNYFTRPGVIEVRAENSVTGKKQCLKVTLGMVGMHIVQKTTIGMGDHWIWSTFEHVDNAPLSPNPRDPATNFVISTSKGNCSLPEILDRPYNFFGEEGGESGPPGSWKWATRPPYAVDGAGQGIDPDRIARCWEILTATKLTNRIWQRELKETVWQNYMLISAQWRGNQGGDGFGIGELPLFLSNTSMESFIQDTGSCLSCHKDARGVNGQFSDFTFLLESVR